MKQANPQPASRYITATYAQQRVSFLGFLAPLFLFVYFMLPQYFGIPMPFFDLTALRIVMIVAMVVILFDLQSRSDFSRVCRQVPYLWPLLAYVLVLFYTMVLRVDMRAFLNPIIEFISYFVLIYFIHSVLGIKKTLRLFLVFAYVLTLLGVVEYLIGTSPFSYMETIRGLYTGKFIRSGSYRIMGPANHSLGYGLILVTIFPIAALDIERGEINLLKNLPLVLLLALNVVLCGSRSTLGVFLLEFVLLFLFSPSLHKKRFFLAGLAMLALLAVFLVVMRETPIARSILLQITSVVDEILGTEFSHAYGANLNALQSSSHYREQLIHIFGLNWLNPFLGIGRTRSLSVEINGSYIYSVDNFYIAEYVRYAWPGLVTFAVFGLCYLAGMLRASIRTGSGLNKALFIGAACYAVNLIWLDSLQTLKYLYLLFALFVANSIKARESSGASEAGKGGSRYLLKPLFLGKRGV